MDSKLEERCPALLLLRKGIVAACEIEPVSEGAKAWIGVYPLGCYEHLRSKGDYRIRVFDVETKYLTDDNDVWDGVMKSRADVYVFGENRMIETVAEFIDPNNLTSTEQSEYPV